MSKINQQTLKLTTHEKIYMTADCSLCENSEEVEKILNELIELVVRENMFIIYEKVFGTLNYKETYQMQRKKLYHRAKIEIPPITYIEGKPVTLRQVASITLYALKIDPSAVGISYCYDSNKNAIGTEISEDLSSYLHLCNIKGTVGKGSEYEFHQMFERTVELLRDRGYEPSQILRTWIYLKDMYENYEQLNASRTAFFDQYNIDYSSKSKELPASTCIGGSADQEYHICMDLICVKGSDIKRTRLYNKYQNEAEGSQYLYKPTFSRGMLLSHPEYDEVQISGTASINEIGDVVFKNDTYEQIKKSLVNVQSLLEQAGLTLQDMFQSTCFFKDHTGYESFQKALNELGISKAFSTCVIADVCREDLLFELDGVAYKMKGE